MVVIPDTIRAACPYISFTKSDISVRSLCAGDSMSLLISKVEPENICLVGRLRSDTMIRYIHIVDTSFTTEMAIKIFQNSNYTTIPPDHSGK